jgi:hypothetical protein
MTQKTTHLSWPEIVRAAYVPPDITGLPLAEALTKVGLAFEKSLAESQSVQDFLAALPKGRRKNWPNAPAGCPDAPVAELAKMLAYRRGDVDRSDTRVWTDFLNSRMRPVFAARRDLTLAMISVSDEPDDVRAFLNAASLVADTCDGLYLEWMHKVVIPFQEMSKEAQDAFRQQWTSKLPVYDYSVYNHESPSLANRETWASAFHFAIRGLKDDFLNLRGCALKLTPPEPELVDYLDALIAAYGETHVDKLESRWAQVDEAWIRIPATSRFVPVHGMENYEHPFGVSPEFRLELRVTTAAQSAEIAAFRQGTQARLGGYGLPEDVRAAALSKLATLDVGIFQSVVEGGVCLSGKLGGQVVPNRQDILARGGKVFIADPLSHQSYTDMLQALVRKHCQPAAAETVSALLSTWEDMRHVLGHEHFHPVGCTPATQPSLGAAFDLLEEAKATIGGLLVARDIDPSLESQRRIAAASVAHVLRFMHKTRLEDASVAPYVRENLIILATLLDSGVMTFTEGEGVSVDFDEDRLHLWFTMLSDFITDVITAYQSGDTKALRQMRDDLCGPTDRGAAAADQAVIAWVNRE